MFARRVDGSFAINGPAVKRASEWIQGHYPVLTPHLQLGVLEAKVGDLQFRHGEFPLQVQRAQRLKRQRNGGLGGTGPFVGGRFYGLFRPREVAVHVYVIHPDIEDIARGRLQIDPQFAFQPAVIQPELERLHRHSVSGPFQ